MNQKANRAIKPTLEEVQEQFRIWRTTRKKRTAIPKDLRQAAIELTRYHPIYTVTKALGLSYTDFKKRIQATRTDVCFDSKSMATFVELDIQKQFLVAVLLKWKPKEGAG